MAKATAALTLALAALAGAAHGAEADPARRSAVVEAVERASPAVVNVSTEEVVEQRGSPFPFPHDPFFDEFFRDFADPRPRRFTRTSLGSGVIVADDGTIITNVHVVVRATRIHVTLADEREFEAHLVGSDADSDLAVLRVESDKPLPAVEMGISSDLMIGETVIAIGNPFGLSHTVTTGVVRFPALAARRGRVYTGFIRPTRP
jgi:S1-C subfamily serine protease